MSIPLLGLATLLCSQAQAQSGSATATATLVMSHVAELSVLAQSAEPPPAIPAAPPPPPTVAPPPPAVAAPPPPPPTLAYAGRSYEQGYSDGRILAESEPMGAWAAVGAGSACLFSGLGCLAATATAGLIEPHPASAYLSGSASPGENDYWAGYREGYSKRVRARRATATFLGGTAVAVVVGGAVVAVVVASSGPLYVY